MGSVLFCLGWHFGSYVGAPVPGKPFDEDACVTFGASIVIVWLLFLPFLRRRLVTARWRGVYAELFTLAWQNKIALAEAAAFTGALWLLLFLWAALFKMLGYSIFSDFFAWPGFIYPFTCVAFGVALHLAGSVERIVTVAREQILGLLKWLAPVAALILALFAPTLLIKLPGLVSSGAKAISAAWLLWLTAVFVLLLNAGYQNGQGDRAYPRALALALRIVVPAMLLVSLTAMYSLCVRIDKYGVTVERVYAIVVALTAVAYSVGYTVASLRGGPWMQGIERVNVVVAIGLMVLIAIMLTPIASPYRLAASSQANRVAELAKDDDARESALRYLRFESGRYGVRRLQALAAAKGNPEALKLGKEARLVLESDKRWGPLLQVANQRDALAAIPAFPDGRRIEPSLASAISKGLRFNANEGSSTAQAAVLFVDLDGDTVEEAVFLTKGRFGVFAQRGSGWVGLGWHVAAAGENPAQVREILAAGDYRVVEPKWHDLRIGTFALQINRAINHNE
jgi:hypothetical protein